VEQLRAERQQYAQLLPVLQQQLTELQQAQQPNWEQLYANDPVEWVRQRELWRDRETRIQATVAEQQRLMGQQQAEQARQLRGHVAEQRGKLLEAIPAWKDQGRWEKDRLALREYGKKLGFTDEELSQAYDHRAVVALYKAMKYEQVTSQRKPLPKPKPKPATVAVPEPRQAARSSAPRPMSDLTKANLRLKRTGKVADLAKVFESLI
jgi:hypothetical protein